MNVTTRLVIAAAVGAVLALAAGAANAQSRPAPSPHRSFSNATQSGAPGTSGQPPRQATQEEMVDAVLGDAMNRLWVQTDHHFHEGEYNHVINLSRVIIQGDPHNVEAYSNASWLLWSTGRSEEAAAILTDGIAANPDSYYMYDEMARYWMIERKDPKQALPYFEKAVSFDCPWLTWNGLANCYEKLDRWDKAVTAWEKAAFYPDDKVAVRRLKQARDRVAQQKPKP